MTTHHSETTPSIRDSELRALLLEYRRENWYGIQLEATQRRIVEELIQGDGLVPLCQVEAYIAISSDSRILDLGSGAGSLVVAYRLLAKFAQLPVVGRAVLWAILKYGSVAEGGCEMLVLRQPGVAGR